MKTQPTDFMFCKANTRRNAGISYKERDLDAIVKLMGDLKTARPPGANQSVLLVAATRPQVRDQQVEHAELLAQLFGKEIVWFLDADRSGLAGVAGGNHQIFVNADVDKPLNVVVGHELAHWMKREVPDVYQAYSQAIFAAAGATTEYQTSRTSFAEYRGARWRDEFVADFMGETLNNPELLVRACGYDPSLSERIAGLKYQFLESVQKLLEKVGLAKPETYPTATGAIVELQTARAAVMTAMRAYAGRRAKSVLTVDNHELLDFMLAPTTPTEAAPKLEVTGSEKLAERLAIARHPSTQAQALTVLAGDEKAEVQIATARHANTPAKVLHGLAVEGTAKGLQPTSNTKLAQAVAGNSNTQADTLTVLVTHRNSLVRALVVQHPNTPVSVLERQANDPVCNVRGLVATNAATPAATLSSLAKDPEPVVRAAAAQNSNTPPLTLGGMVKDEHEQVALALAGNPNTPSAGLVYLGTHPSARVRAQLAGNANIPKATLLGLVNDKAVQVQLRLADNPATPTEALDQLAKAKAVQVRIQATNNPNWTPAHLAEESDPKLLSPEAGFSPERTGLVSMEQAQQAVRELSQRVKAVEFVVLSKAEFAAKFPKQLATTPGLANLDAVYVQGSGVVPQVVLVPENIPSREGEAAVSAVQRAGFHVAASHHAFRELFGEQAKPALTQIWHLAAKSDQPEVQQAVKHVQQTYPGASQPEQAEQLLGTLQEHRQHEALPFWKQARGTMRDLVRTVLPQMRFDEGDVEYLLWKARQAAEQVPTAASKLLTDLKNENLFYDRQAEAVGLAATVDATPEQAAAWRELWRNRDEALSTGGKYVPNYQVPSREPQPVPTNEPVLSCFEAVLPVADPSPFRALETAAITDGLITVLRPDQHNRPMAHISRLCTSTTLEAAAALAIEGGDAMPGVDVSTTQGKAAAVKQLVENPNCDAVRLQAPSSFSVAFSDLSTEVTPAERAEVVQQYAAQSELLGKLVDAAYVPDGDGGFLLDAGKLKAMSRAAATDFHFAEAFEKAGKDAVVLPGEDGEPDTLLVLKPSRLQEVDRVSYGTACNRVRTYQAHTEREVDGFESQPYRQVQPASRIEPYAPAHSHGHEVGMS